MSKLSSVLILLLLSTTLATAAANVPWYTEGNYAPATRIAVTLTNTLDFARTNCPVAITRDMMPLRDLNEMWVTVVDPSLTPRPEPDAELLARQGGHLLLGEANGRQLSRQVDDLDKDGIWDEIFFQVDIGARETKTVYIYIGFSQRGWDEHGTHAAIGSYCRHIVPFWESANIGWKLWYPTNIDMFGKRESVLMSQELYMKNLNGYAVEWAYGSDIQRVEDTFGAGGICLFEDPTQPARPSRPRINNFAGGENQNAWNEGQISDTRYAYDVVVNGPVRSMVRIKTMNWRTDGGAYELEQYYTAYRNQSYSTCRVRYTVFDPVASGVAFGCGIRRNASEFDSLLDGNTVVTIGNDDIIDPDDPDGESLHVDYVGNALVVKDSYNPRFRFIEDRGGNYAFSIPVNDSRTFEYLIAGGWSEGAVLNTPDEFKEYVVNTAAEYNNPLVIGVGEVERK